MTDTKEHGDTWVGDLLRELPTPTLSVGFFPRVMAEMRSPRLDQRRRAGHLSEPGGRLILALTAVLTVALALPSGFFLGAASVNADPGIEPVNDVTSFASAPGWNTVTTTFGPSGQKLSIAWAANVPFAAEENLSGFPSETVTSLPEGGIALVAIGPREYTGASSFPQLEDPLSLSQGSCVWDEYEGQPASNVSKCMVDVMVGDRLLNVIVWFGSTEPGPDTIAAANEELRRLTI